MSESAEILKENESLKKASKTIFGDSARLEIVDPKSLLLLKENARYFKKDCYRQLVANIKQDKRLSSVPLCHTTETGTLEVLSGNHRVQAAIDAGVAHILVIVLTKKLSKSAKIAVQLSHNALVGEDDVQVLANLWGQIDDIKERLYAGLSSETINELEKIELVNLSTPAVYTQTLTFAFTSSEAERLENVIEELSRTKQGEMYAARLAEFEQFFAALQDVKELHEIKNGSLAMLKILEIIENHLKERESGLYRSDTATR